MSYIYRDILDRLHTAPSGAALDEICAEINRRRKNDWDWDLSDQQVKYLIEAGKARRQTLSARDSGEPLPAHFGGKP